MLLIKGRRESSLTLHSTIDVPHATFCPLLRHYCCKRGEDILQAGATCYLATSREPGLSRAILCPFARWPSAGNSVRRGDESAMSAWRHC
jgi:hypothetical protein